MLDAMLERIGHSGAVTQDSDTLTALHRAWRRAVPYENLDIQLGRPIRLDDESLYDKLIRRGRGGYCYEQNAVLCMLLRAAGFPVTVLEGAVLRETHGEARWGNHVVLLVTVGDERWIADAGIGDGFLDPLPLREGRYEQDGLVYRLERLDRDTWRFHHHPGGTISSYDFRLEAREIGDFADHSDRLSTSPESPYVTTLIVGRPLVDHTALLLSRTVRRLGAADPCVRTVGTPDEFARLLRETFHVPLDDLGRDGLELLWGRAGAQDALWRARVDGG
ncbi:N-hydroxyarylamine O-acetyltransferase [Pseudonocardia ammonioxydans]|uniref:N-hydroxyarylamine O-acetyltransferase n=1 Tax=Pseudonocardia ammonioxydans TaxID=260086 RepID=A0A1I5DZU2_PSUAM|nr:N-hydroxyarylamine O-acetyltransferase [Pseudonocardia ammonioxydans]